MDVLKEISGYIINNDIENAYKLIDKIEDDYINNPEYWNLRGVLCINIGEYTTAIECLKNALKIQPDNSDSYYNYAYALENIGEFRKAALNFGLSYKFTIDNDLKSELASLYSENTTLKNIFNEAAHGNRENTNCTVVVLSCDAYSDLWEPFFKLKNKYWDCPYDTYLVTETKQCEYAKTINVKTDIWTKRVREALQVLDSEYVIILLEDFFIRSRVDQERIDYCLTQFSNNTAMFNFEKCYDTRDLETNIKGFKKRHKTAPYKCSCQAGIWNREKLIKLLENDQNAWQWELKNEAMDYEYYINNCNYIINYGHVTGEGFGVIKGKWCSEVIPFFEKEQIKVDYEKRGFADQIGSINIQEKIDLDKYLFEAEDLTAMECFQRGKLYRGKNNLIKSLFFYDSAFKKIKKLPSTNLSQDHPFSDYQHYLEEVIQKIKEDIVSLVSQNFYNEALRLVDKSLQIVTNDVDMYSIKSVIMIKHERYEEAKEILNKGLSVNPEHIDCLYNLAYIYEIKNQMNLAADLYNKILKFSHEENLLKEVKSKIINWQQACLRREMENRFANSKYAKKQELVLRKEKSDDRIHVVYVLTHVGICGGVKIILEQANRLSKLGMNVSLVCHYPMPTWYPVEVNYIQVPFNVELSAGIPDCDVIVATYWDHIQVCIDKKIAPVIYFEQGDFHLFDYENMKDSLKAFIYHQYQLPEFIYTVTNQAANLIKKVYNRDANVIHNAIDTSIYYDDINNKTTDKIPYILMMGNAHIKFKGIDQIIEAYKRVKVQIPSIQLYWITPSIPPSEYVKEVNRYFVNPPQHKIAELYREASVFVSASHYESFSLPVLEAMACGCPVVTTGNEGVLEYAKDNINVLIAEIGNPNDVAEKVLKVLGDENLKSELTYNGLSTIQKFDWNIIISKLLNLFKEVSCYKVNKKKTIIVGERPKLSIILPVFNSEKFLQITISSILNQTYTDFELIIVNDGSNDKSEDIIKTFGDLRINYIYQENQGAAAARNKGLDIAKGDFITFHDADDISINNRFETLLKKFDNNRIDAVHSDMLLINESGNTIGYWQSANLEREKVLKYFVKQGTPFNNPSFVFRKKAIGNIRYKTDLKIGEDTKFILEVVKNIDTLHIPEPLLLYRRHSSNSTNTKDYHTLFSHVNSMLEEVSLEALFPELDWEKHNYNFNLVRAKTIISLYLSRRGMNKEAQSWFDDVTKLNQCLNDVNLKSFVLGIGNLINKNYDESVNLLSNYTPRDHVVENYLGEVYSYKNDIEKAMESFLNAIRLYPNYVDAQENLKSLGGLKGYNIIDKTWRKYITL